MNVWRPKMPNTVKKNTQNNNTFPIIGIARSIVSMSVRIPGMTESDRSGRRTRTTRRAETPPPMPGRSDTSDTTTTKKSMTFHPSLRYDPFSK